MVKIISWNVRGLNDKGKRDLVRNLINQWGADVYILLETKLKDNISSLIHSIWNNRWLSELHVEAQGSNGGILTMWDKRIWEGVLVEAGSQCISCKFSDQNQEFS